MAHRVDTTSRVMQATHCETMHYRTPVEPHGNQLPSRDKPVLILRQLGNRKIRVGMRPSQSINAMF